MTVSVVIVSASEDNAFLGSLTRHLAPHLKSKLIELWSEGDIGGGQERERELRDRLDAAKIIVLLVSPDLIALGVGVVADIDGALARRKPGEVEVVPVLVRHCDWKATPLAGLQALPRDERPVGTWQHPDLAWTEIVREIQALAERFAASSAVTASPHGSRAPSTPPPSVRPTGVFVGREAELRALDEALLPASGAARPMAICALHGMPGVGKSYLADHFAALRADRFPGGVVRLVLRSDEKRPAREIEAHLLGQLADQLHVPVGAADAAERIRERLLHPRRLVHIENVDAFASAQAAIALVSKLRGCSVVLTGRHRDLAARGWARIELAPFDEGTSLKQLEEELHPAHDAAERERYRRLAEELGHLPLALHLAASYLREGAFTIETLLERLRGVSFDLSPDDPADWALRHEPARANLRRTFELSRDLLRRDLGADADALLAGFAALGHAPLAGFGRSLGAATAGLSAVDFARLVHAVRKLSLLMLRSGEPSEEPRWHIHPLLAEMLRRQPGSEAALERMTEWFLERLPELPPEQAATQGERWKEIHRETPALVAWLHRLSGSDVVRAVRAGAWYAVLNGPYAAWLGLHERGLASVVEADDRSRMLWAFMYIARYGGVMDQALTLAADKQSFEQRRGNELEAARAAGCRSAILTAQGKLDEALRIMQEHELPVFGKLGYAREHAVTTRDIADIFLARGDADEALRMLQEEVLPVFERLGEVRDRAVTMGRIATILQRRGEVDEALRIRQEEVLPVYEKLGLVRDLVLARAKLALNLLARSAPGDRDAAARLLDRAHESAQALGIPEADQIRRSQQEHGLLPPDPRRPF